MPSGRVSTSRRTSPTSCTSRRRADRAILADIPKYRTELIDTCLEQDDEAMEKYLNDEIPPSAEVLRRSAAQRHDPFRFHTGALRFVVQEQGRAAGARRSRRLLARANDVAAIKTVDADGEPIGERKCFR